MTCWWNWIEGGGNVRIQAIIETAIYVDDLQAAETFNGTILGLRVIGKEPGRHVFFQVGEGYSEAIGRRAGTMTRITLPQVVECLQAHYGKQKPPKLAGPWEMILWENVAYLADDERRLKAFRTLKRDVGIKPDEIL